MERAPSHGSKYLPSAAATYPTGGERVTMPVERTRNLIQAGAFLRELSANSALPAAIRTEAYRLLRHFPSVSDVEAIAANEARLMQVAGSPLIRNYLVAEFDPDWVRGYTRGPHIGG